MMEAASTNTSSKLLKIFKSEHLLSYSSFLRLGIALGHEVRGGGGRDGDQAYGEHRNLNMCLSVQC